LVHSIAASDPAYCGLITWCGVDYPSASGWIQDKTKTIGVFDLFRIPKLGSSMYMAQVSKEIVIEPSFYWSFDGKFSVSTLGNESYIWSNAESLELFVDSKSFITLKPSTSESFKWLKYPPFIADFRTVGPKTLPDLKINALVGGQPVTSRLFSSNTTSDRFTLVADDKDLSSDGSDTTRLVFQVEDQYGNRRPSTVGSVQFQVTGTAGNLIGPNPFPIDQTTGAGAVWIRSAGVGIRGRVSVVAKHQFLGTASVDIQIL